MRIDSLIIILFVLGLTFYMGYSILVSSFTEDSNYCKLVDILTPCQSFDRSFDNDSKLIVLRVDDIQSHYLRNLSIKIIEVAFEYEMPLSLSVIPKNLEDDPIIIKYLNKNKCNLDLALHGWDNKPDFPEFSNLTEIEATERIIKGLSVFKNAGFGTPITFVPPNNVYSNGTKKALGNLGFKLISSEGNETYDYTTATYDFDIDETVDARSVLDSCQKGFDKNNVCVIMIHPKDFTTNDSFDENKYQIYLDLLDEINKTNIKVVTFKELYSLFGGKL